MPTHMEATDFIPDHSGMRALYYDSQDPSNPIVEPVVGWLKQREVEWDPRTGELIKETSYIEFVAAILSYGAVDAAKDADNFWFILAPGAPMPDAAECQSAYADYEKRRADRARKRQAG